MTVPSRVSPRFWTFPYGINTHVIRRNPSPSIPTGRTNHGQNQGRRQSRRTRRRRDDPCHLERHQEPSDPAVPRRGFGLLRSGHRKPRRHRRSGDRRRGEGHPARTCRRQMRHHHPGRGARQGVRPQEDVEVPQWYHPQHSRRHHLPRADRHEQCASPGPGMDQADRRGTSRLRRPVQSH